MRVTIEIDTDNRRELDGLAVLFAVLRGDSDIPVPPGITFESPAPKPPESAAPPPPPAPPAPPPPASESLLAGEAARVAAAPPPPPASAGETDVHGVPWDERIHAGTKVKNADGSWRTKRGADPALVASVTAELKGAVPAGAPVPPPPTPAGPSDADTAFGAGGAAPASDVPPPPPPPPPEAAAPPPPAPPADVPPPPADATGINYPAIIARANALDKDYDSLNAMGKMFGLEKFSDLAKRPDLFEAFMAALG